LQGWQKKEGLREGLGGGSADVEAGKVLGGPGRSENENYLTDKKGGLKTGIEVEIKFKRGSTFGPHFGLETARGRP